MPPVPTPAPVRAPDATSSARPSWAERPAALACALLPAGVALTRLAHDPAWREDVAVLRQVGLVGMGLGGAISTALAQVATVLPLGTLAFRGALVSVLALVVACRFAFDIALRLLRAAGRGPGRPAPDWVAPAFASIGVTSAALGPSFQLEATASGGAMVACALAIGALALALRAVDASAPADRGRDIVCAGVLLGATAAERVTSAVAVAVALVMIFTVHHVAAWLGSRWAARGAQRLAPVPRRAALLGGAFAVGTWLVASAPALLRPHATHRALDFGASLAPLPRGASAVVSEAALGAWASEMGWSPLALACVGALVLVLRGATRPGAAALLSIVALDALLPTHALDRAALDAATPLRVLALGGMAIAAAVGLHEAIFRLLRARIPYARPAVALLMAFQATIVALASEQASSSADRGRQRGPEEWLDATRASLEARSVLLVQGSAVATRVWAAQLAGGFRPDVLVVSTALLGRGGVAADVLAREPRALEAVRSIALRGEPDELGLSSLADVRTLHVEASRTWDARDASHVQLDGMWLEFSPQPIGPSDRRRNVALAMKPIARLLAALAPTASPDAPTVDLVATELREQALVLVRLGDPDTARALSAEARALGPTRGLGSPAGTMLLAALDATAKNPTGNAVITTRTPLPVRTTAIITTPPASRR